MAQNDTASDAEVASAVGTSKARRTQKCVKTIKARPAATDTNRSTR